MDNTFINNNFLNYFSIEFEQAPPLFQNLVEEKELAEPPNVQIVEEDILNLSCGFLFADIQEDVLDDLVSETLKPQEQEEEKVNNKKRMIPLDKEKVSISKKVKKITVDSKQSIEKKTKSAFSTRSGQELAYMPKKDYLHQLELLEGAKLKKNVKNRRSKYINSNGYNQKLNDDMVELWKKIQKDPFFQKMIVISKEKMALGEIMEKIETLFSSLCIQMPQQEIELKALRFKQLEAIPQKLFNQEVGKLSEQDKKKLNKNFSNAKSYIKCRKENVENVKTKPKKIDTKDKSLAFLSGEEIAEMDKKEVSKKLKEIEDIPTRKLARDRFRNQKRKVNNQENKVKKFWAFAREEPSLFAITNRIDEEGITDVDRIETLLYELKERVLESQQK